MPMLIFRASVGNARSFIWRGHLSGGDIITGSSSLGHETVTNEEGRGLTSKKVVSQENLTLWVYVGATA
jgi:hypothetical protein